MLSLLAQKRVSMASAGCGEPMPPCRNASPVKASPTASASSSGVDRSRRRSSPRRPNRPIAATDATSRITANTRPASGLANQAQSPAIAAPPAPASSSPRPVAGPSRRRRATTLSSATPGVRASTQEPEKSPAVATPWMTLLVWPRLTDAPQATSSTAATGAGQPAVRPPGRLGSLGSVSSRTVSPIVSSDLGNGLERTATSARAKPLYRIGNVGNGLIADDSLDLRPRSTMSRTRPAVMLMRGGHAWCTWWMPEAGTQADAGLATAMRISITRLARRLRVERLGLGGSEAILSDIQLAALAALERHDAMTPGELAEHEKVQPPSMTRVIAVLEERGLVRRAAHPTDRRQVILTVTQQGRDLVQLVRRRREAWLAQRMQELTPEERATLLAAAPILEKLSQS